MGREDNIAIFKDTEKMYRTNCKIKESLLHSIAQQKLVLEEDNLPEIHKYVYEEPARIVVSKKRTLEAAAGYRGQKVCVHNFASATNPGGGVTSGANAQEECLCRCSGLYFCLDIAEMWEGFYLPHRRAHNPLHNDDLIYTPELVVFKTDTDVPETMPEADWYKVNVITCAAPNLRPHPGNMFNQGDGKATAQISDEELLALHEKRLSRILDVAVLEGSEVMILGAFGCGAFANNPEVVAKAAKNVMEEYQYAFKTIEFAVYCSPRDERNYTVFKQVVESILVK